MCQSELIADLQAWYSAQCNGDWEHAYGVDIGTLDNPGWYVNIDLVGTILQDKSFEAVSHGESAGNDGANWIECRVEDNEFRGSGGPKRLKTIIRIFLDWAKTEEDWLAALPEMTEEEHAREWFQSLGEEIGPETCRRSGCDRLRIKYSVYCREHHFEQMKGYLPNE